MRVLARASKSSKSSKTKENEASEPDSTTGESVVPGSEPSESEAAEALAGAGSAADAPDGVEDAIVIEESETEGDATEETAAEIESPEVPGVIPTSGGPAPMAPAPAPASGPPVLALIFGGVLAGAVGYLAATLTETSAPVADPRVAELSAEIETLRDQIATASDMTVEMPASTDLGPLNEALVDLNLRVGVVNEQIDRVWSELESSKERLTALEDRPVANFSDGSAALEAFRAELDAVTAEARAEVEAARARATEIEAAAAEAAVKADADAAMIEVASALEAGIAFSGPLSRLKDVPRELNATADKGVPTLATLQSEFPGAARRALAEAQVVPEEASPTDRLAAFLRRQTNARSLSPREGDDPDAILSRAESALADGDVSTALVELEALPEGSRAAMDDWIEAAELRARTLAAFAAFADAQN